MKVGEEEYSLFRDHEYVQFYSPTNRVNIAEMLFQAAGKDQRINPIPKAIPLMSPQNQPTHMYHT